MSRTRGRKRARKIARILLARHLRESQGAQMRRRQFRVVQVETPMREMPMQNGEPQCARARTTREHALTDKNAPARNAVAAGDEFAGPSQTS
jgi:hypothetical protein